MIKEAIQIPITHARKDISINGKKYNTLYLSRKSLFPHANVDFVGYYGFDLKEHGILFNFLFVEEVLDNANGLVHKNVLFDPAGDIVGHDLPVKALKAAALKYIGKKQRN